MYFVSKLNFRLKMPMVKYLFAFFFWGGGDVISKLYSVFGERNAVRKLVFLNMLVVFFIKELFYSNITPVYCCGALRYHILFFVCILLFNIIIIVIIIEMYSCYSGRFDIWNLFLVSNFLRKEVADASCLQGIYMRLASVLQSDLNYSEQ